MASPYFPEDLGEVEVPGRAFGVRFGEPAYRRMLELAGAQHSTMSEVMRQALSVYWWLAREHGMGSRFLVQRERDVTVWTIPSLDGMEPLAPLEESEEVQPPVEGPLDGSGDGRQS